ncbi:unnamed protein product [Arctogadus glacialis]
MGQVSAPLARRIRLLYASTAPSLSGARIPSFGPLRNASSVSGDHEAMLREDVITLTSDEEVEEVLLGSPDRSDPDDNVDLKAILNSFTLRSHQKMPHSTIPFKVNLETRCGFAAGPLAAEKTGIQI